MKKHILKLVVTLLIATMLMGTTTVYADGIVCTWWFAQEGSDEIDWSISENCMRVYVKNNGTSNIKCYVSKGNTTYDPFIVNVGKGKSQTYEKGAGDYTMYVVNEDGSQLDADLTVRELKYPY